MTTFTTNLKQYRMAKGLTQEQAAEALGVSTQTVSRWECGTTLPDAVILPRIAELYCVTIDDLYRERTVAYANYAARLGSVFEASHRPEDFIRADTEYRKLLKSGVFTSEDLRLYGILNQYMMEVCRDRAEELFRRVLTAGPGDNPETYWSVQRQRGYFLWELGRIGEVVETFLPLVEGGSGELQEWICLIQALFFAKDYDTALHRAEQAEGRFPESAILHIYMGDLLQALGRSDEAFPHWQRALEMEPEWCDAAYSMAACYEERGEYEKACRIYSRIAEDLQARGFDLEANQPRVMADMCREKDGK